MKRLPWVCVSSLLLSGTGCPEKAPSGLLPDRDAAPDPGPDAALPVASPVALCDFHAPVDPTRPVLAYVDAGVLWWVHADGSTTDVHHFERPANLQWGGEVVVVGDFVAASYPTADEPVEREAVLLDRSGALLWQRSGLANSDSTLFLAADGRLAVRTAIGGSVVVDAAGTVVEIPGLAPLGEPAADGRMPVWYQDAAGTNHVAWWPSMAPLAHPADLRYAWPRWVGEELVYMTSLDGGFSIVAESAAGARLFPVAWSEPYAGVIDALYPWVLIGARGAATPYARLDLIAGELAYVGNDLPYGLQRFHVAQYLESALLDDDGALLVGLRNAYWGGLYRSSDDGASWEEVGGTIGDTLAIMGVGRAGTYVVASTTDLFSDEIWEEPPAGTAPDMVRNSVHVAEGDRVAAILVDGEHNFGSAPPFWFSGPPVDHARRMISPDGACVAYLAGTGAGPFGLHALVVASGETFDLATVSDYNGAERTVWLP